MEILKLEKVVFNPENKMEILRDIDLTILQGEIVSIIGNSGAGKTTLLNIMSGLLAPTSGAVYYNGENITLWKEKRRAKLRICNFGYVFQGFYLLSDLTVYDNIILPALASKEIIDNAYIEELIDTLSLKDRLNHKSGSLSGGEKQRVAIARAMVNKPQILFADEPTGNLDSKNGERVFDLMIKCSQKYNQTLVYVTHDNEKAKLALRNIKMKDGEIVEVF